MNKVLIVDDDKNLLDVLRYNLVNDGYTVVTAEDGIQVEKRREKRLNIHIHSPNC